MSTRPIPAARSACPMVLLLLVAGCAGSMGTIRPNPVAPPVTAFDGSYRNTLRLTSTAGGAEGTDWCQSPGQPVITVAKGQFTYAVPHPNVPGTPLPTFEAVMADDGTFAGQATVGVMSGWIKGSHIEGKIDGSGCVYGFSGDKV